MIVSVKDRIRFTPFDQRDAEGNPLPGAPVYLIEPPTLLTRAKWDRGCKELGAKPINSQEARRALMDAITEIVDEPSRSELLGFIEDYVARSDALTVSLADVAREFNERAAADIASGEDAAAEPSDELPADLTAALEEFRRLTPRMEDLTEQMRAMHEGYARKLARLDYWASVAPLVAAQVFIVGWENVDVRFRRVGGVVPMETLEGLPKGHVIDAGWTAIRAFNTTPDETKN